MNERFRNVLTRMINSINKEIQTIDEKNAGYAKYITNYYKGKYIPPPGHTGLWYAPNQTVLNKYKLGVELLERRNKLERSRNNLKKALKAGVRNFPKHAASVVLSSHYSTHRGSQYHPKNKNPGSAYRTKSLGL